MAKKPLPTPELLRQLLRYEPECGLLFWRERPLEFFSNEASCNAWNSRRANKEAFIFIDNYGYRRGKIFGAHHRAHRVIWAMHYDAWPEADIDHLDGNRTNNRLENLRDISRTMNMRNAKMYRHNKSGATGVSWDGVRQKWQARIISNGQKLHLGYFDDIQSAAAARASAAAEIGYTERHGLS